jgi:hypothetical protein
MDADKVIRSNLQSQRARRSTDDLEEERRAASPRHRALCDTDEAAVEELPRDGSNRRRAETEAARDFGAGDRACGPDEAKDRGPVDVARKARRRRLVRRAVPLRYRVGWNNSLVKFISRRKSRPPILPREAAKMHEPRASPCAGPVN